VLPILKHEEEIGREFGDWWCQDSTPLIGRDQEACTQIDPEHAAASDGDHVKVVTEILNDLDWHFLEASESSHQLLEILKVPHIGYWTRVHYVAQVMRVIKWNHSLEGVSDECEIHANIPEWEEKLYNELKAVKSKKFEYERKVASLNNNDVKCVRVIGNQR